MAIFHHSIKIISRGKGSKSAVAAAAYRAGEKIQSEYNGRINDYTRKGGIVYTEILLPVNAPPEYIDRAVLWNAVEKVEKAKNAQLAREIELALPVELPMEQNRTLVREYVKRCFVKQGMCADICIHDKNDGNPHAHIMLTMRPFNENGSWGAKQKKEYIFDDNGEKIYDKKKRQYKCRSIPTTNWNEHSKAEEWRETWAKFVNMFLKAPPLRSSVRVDHRSYKRQGIEQIPTVHLGVAAHRMEKRGIKTERGNLNREIGVTNQKLRQLKARINKLQDWLNEEATKAEPPTLYDVISNILAQNEQSGESNQYNNIKNLKAAAQTLIFLQNNNITDISALDEKIKAMSDRNKEMQEKLKPIERRLSVLDEHIKHSQNYKAYRNIYNKYKNIDNQNERGLYRRDNYHEILCYEAALEYLKRNFPDKKLFLNKWIPERDELLAKKDEINQIFLPLKENTAHIERIRKNVCEIMQIETHDIPTEAQKPTRKKSYGMEL